MSEHNGLAILSALLASGAINTDDLAAVRKTGPEQVPTHQEYLTVVIERCPPPSLSTYLTTFRRIAAAFADAPVTGLTSTDVATMARTIRAGAAGHRGGGVGAEAGFIRAARFWCRCVVEDGYRGDNPAAAVAVPTGRARVRRALSESELRTLYLAVLATSGDPDLDLLLVDFHRETAARRIGAINLRLSDLNAERRSVLLREKYGHEREIPLSLDVQQRIVRLVTQRSALVGSAFRYRSGRPLSRRHYNTLFERVRAVTPWAERLGVSIHWIRHTTLTDIARATNGRIASEYAGHTDRSVTDLYTVPTFEDLVIAHDMVFPDFRCGPVTR